MGKKLTALALAALLTLGLNGCGSGNNATTDSSYGTRGVYDTYGNSDGRGRGLMGELGDGIDNTIDDLGDAIRDAGDTLSGDSRRYQEMLENGRVHDSDGFLLDGENRHD